MDSQWSPGGGAASQWSNEATAMRSVQPDCAVHEVQCRGGAVRKITFPLHPTTKRLG